MKNMSMKDLEGKNLIILFTVGVLCLLLGIGLYAFFDSRQDEINRKVGMIYTNPALNYRELNEMISTNKIINLSQEVDDYASYKKSLGELTFLSVYYRNLNNGGYFGVNQNENFSPASLMKLPLLIAYMKKSEKIPGFLKQKVIYKKSTKNQDYKQNIPPEEQLQDGKEYTIRQICEYMIKYSDNDASSFLEKYITFADIRGTFEDMGIAFPTLKNGEFENNVKVVDYASFFRILFNASYLNREDSEKILKLLSEIEFDNGLNGGIPDNIKISHKFGERGIIGTNGTEEKQLHDCGIVYYPNHPYILCVMSRGFNMEKLENAISEVSQIIYDEVQTQYGENPLDTSDN